MKNLSIKKQVEVALNEGLRKKGIPNFLELKLKELNRGVKNMRTHIETSVFRKAGKSLLEDYSLEELEEHIGNAGPYKLSIGRMGDPTVLNNDYKDRLMKAVDSSIGRNEILELVVTDTREKEGFVTRVLTVKDVNMKKKGSLSLRSSQRYYQIENLDKVVGMVFVLNSLISYIEENREMSYLALYGAISRRGSILVETEEEKYEVIERYNKLGLDVSKLVTLSDFGKNVYGKMLESIDSGSALSLKDLYYVGRIRDEENDLSFATITGNQLNTLYFIDIYDFVISMNKEEESRAKRNVADESDYARSYENKKNVPLFIQERMENNVFVEHFDFVELDEMVDLEKFKIIEKDWTEFMEKINFPISENHSLRFRRLGNHKAGGLYFPGPKAVCVDLDNSASLVHELLHMLDFSKEINYSERFEFRSIIESYKEALEKDIKELDEDHPIKQNWNSKNKYNKEYYLSSEEIFARTGEIYIRRFRGIDSHIIKGKGTLYPEGEELETKIEKYFNRIFLRSAESKVKQVS